MSGFMNASILNNNKKHTYLTQSFRQTLGLPKHLKENHDLVKRFVEHLVYTYNNNILTQSSISSNTWLTSPKLAIKHSITHQSYLIKHISTPDPICKKL